MGNMLDIVNQEVYYVCNVFLICCMHKNIWCSVGLLYANSSSVDSLILYFKILGKRAWNTTFMILCCENGPASFVPQGVMRNPPHTKVWDLDNIATLGNFYHPLILVKKLAIRGRGLSVLWCSFP